MGTENTLEDPEISRKAQCTATMEAGQGRFKRKHILNEQIPKKTIWGVGISAGREEGPEGKQGRKSIATSPGAFQGNLEQDAVGEENIIKKGTS